jgi:hypothetical protein
MLLMQAARKRRDPDRCGEGGLAAFARAQAGRARPLAILASPASSHCPRVRTVAMFRHVIVVARRHIQLSNESQGFCLNEFGCLYFDLPGLVCDAGELRVHRIGVFRQGCSGGWKERNRRERRKRREKSKRP